MRRSVAVLFALVCLIGLPVGASAARMLKETDHAISVNCDGMTSTAGTTFAFFGASLSDMFGPDAGLDAWAGTEPIGPADLSRDFEQPADVTWDGTSLAGSFALVHGDGSPDGVATFSAAFSPAGAAQPFQDSFKDGNRRVSFSGTSQTFSIAGSLSLSSGPVFDLGACAGDETTVTSTATNPTTYTSRFSQRFVGCDLSNTAGDTGFLFVDLQGADSFVDSGLFPVGGPPNIGANGPIDLADGSVDTDLATYDFDTGDASAATAHLTMTATATGETFTNVLKNATSRRVTRGQLIDIEGSLTIAGRVFDLGACVGQDSTTKIIETHPHGPKPGGKAPANDLPTGAKALSPGSSVTLQTKGASPTAEAPYACLDFIDPETGEVFVTPVGNTVWYSFIGTGGSMTVDTAGSDFDTVVAIYTRSGTTYTAVDGGCVDDTPTPPIGRTTQASVTIPTVAGTTYYVQIGGFPDAFPYGNLKVRLR